MNKIGILSLNAGAPDLRLTGDQRPTYTQRRRNQMAYGGIAGLDGRKAYGIGSWLQEQKDKFVDDIIPNEIKENPLLATLGGGALLNQFGLPDFLTESVGMGSDVGQNWLGDLLGAVIPGEAAIDTVIGKGGVGYTLPELIQGMPGQGTGIAGMDDAGLNPNWAAQLAADVASGKLSAANLPESLKGIVASQVSQKLGTGTTGTDASGRYPINWQTPLAIGTTVGALDYATRSDDTMPAQLAIDPSRFATAAAAKADPNLRFKPQEAYTLKDGGRIGYRTGKGVESIPTDQMEAIKGQTAESKPVSIDDLIKPIYDRLIAQGMSHEEASKEIFRILQGKAKGGRIGLKDGTKKRSGIKKLLSDLEERFPELMTYGSMLAGSGIPFLKDGGRIGYADGTMSPALQKRMMELLMQGISPDKIREEAEKQLRQDPYIKERMGIPGSPVIKEAAQGGRIGAQEGGLMDLGGMEIDYRQEGGFVPIGGQEKADDVPARLSKNEFVFTADAVRAAGGGYIDEGAAVMERLMENLEAGGKVSEDSQGLEGAQAMFANTQKLQNRII